MVLAKLELAICKKILERNGSWFRGELEKDRGSGFNFRLAGVQ